MHHRRIYVDYDDVLSETARAFITLLENHHKKTVAFDDIMSFDLGLSFDLSAQELERFMELAHQPEVLCTLKPIEGAVEALKQFITMGYEIAVITGRPPSTVEVSKAWLDEKRIPYHSLTFVDKYGRAERQNPYARAITLDELAEMSFCYAVEDSGDMAAFLTNMMALPVGLLERPWNRAFQFTDPQSRALIDHCVNWDAVADRLSRRVQRA